MPVRDDAHCAICGVAGIGGEIRLGRLFRRAGEAWREGPPGDIVGLCATCFPTFSNGIGAALITSPAVENTAMRQVRNPDGACDFCDADITNEAFSVEVIPHTRGYLSRAGQSGYLVKHVGDIRKQRVCFLCYLWCLSAIDDPTALLGESFRASCGPPGEWIWEVMTDVSSINLSSADTRMLAGTVAAMGRVHIALRLKDLQNPAAPTGEAVFVGSGRGRQASRILEAMPPELRKKAVLVARIDAIHEAERCIELGVRDLLVSPLSSHQVLGAIERLWPHKSFAASRLGQPRNSLLLTPKQASDRMLLRLTLRRFLRGFDRVEPEGDNLRLSIYCPEDQIPSVVRRIGALLGNRAQVRSVRAPKEQAAA